MSIKIKNLDDLMDYIQELPSDAIADIDKRISDWRASGGKENDPYIKQQFRYAENILNRK